MSYLQMAAQFEWLSLAYSDVWEEWALHIANHTIL